MPRVNRVGALLVHVQVFFDVRPAGGSGGLLGSLLRGLLEGDEMDDD